MVTGKWELNSTSDNLY